MPPNVPQTLLPLETFRADFGFHPYFFYALANKLLPITDSSDQLVAEYTWQRPNAAARSDYRQAIAKAEQKLSTALGYDVSTRYRQQVLSAWQDQDRGYGYPYGYGGGPINGYGSYSGQWGGKVAYLQVGKLQRIATVTYEALGDCAVTYTDENNDLIKDTFAGTFADTTTDPATVIAAFKVADRVGPPKTLADPVNWQIRPATITRLNPTTLTVTGPSQLLVKPGLYEKVTPSQGYNSTQNGLDSSGSLDPNDTNTNFVAGLTLYKKVYSAENQATFVRRYGSTEETYQVDATIANADMGQVQINLAGCYGSTNPPTPLLFPGGPAVEEIRISYEAGATSADMAGQAQYLPYQTDWDTVVARFAAAELAADPAVTQRRNPQLHYWREDLAMIGNAQLNNLYRVSNEILNNGFKNTRRGAVEAWQAVVSLAQLRAIQT